MSERKLNVYFKKELIGTLIEKHEKFLDFEYVHDAKYDLSFALKRKEEPFDRTIVKSFFENLLPEGEVLDLVAKAYNVSKNNPFSMLSVIGEDCAGAITIASDISSDSILLKPLENTVLKNYMDNSRKGLSYYQKGMRLSVAGAQNKTAVYIDNENHYFVPNYDFPSTHILKFENSHYPNILLNEFFCSRLAEIINLPVSQMELYADNDFEYLKIKRFDRDIKDDKVEKLHVEDFGQIAGVLSSNKYELEGGPSFKDIVI